MKKNLIAIFSALIILELIGYALSALNIEPTGFKLYVNKEWADPKNAYADRDSLVGVWHLPNDKWIQNGPCFTTTMEANQYGARDNKWDVSKPGYLFLGSSFVEGYGVAYGKRFTEIFEKLEGKEVFNCGMAGGFTPVQYYMTLKKFKDILKFDTCFVFLALPTDEKLITRIEKNRYRPYLINDSITYTKSTKSFPERKSFKTKAMLLIKQYCYIYHLFDYFNNRNLLKSRVVNSNIAITDDSYPDLEKVLKLFAKDFPDKHFKIVLLPTLTPSKGAPRMPAANFKLIDLRNTLNNSTDYFICNTHWNVKGNEKVAQALYKSVK